MGFIQVFAYEDCLKLIEQGLHYVTEQSLGDGKKVYIFVNDKMKFNNSDISKFRIINKLYFN